MGERATTAKILESLPPDSLNVFCVPSKDMSLDSGIKDYRGLTRWQLSRLITPHAQIDFAASIDSVKIHKQDRAIFVLAVTTGKKLLHEDEIPTIESRQIIGTFTSDDGKDLSIQIAELIEDKEGKIRNLISDYSKRS